MESRALQGGSGESCLSSCVHIGDMKYVANRNGVHSSMTREVPPLVFANN
jgi:hypothetical protein